MQSGWIKLEWNVSEDGILMNADTLNPSFHGFRGNIRAFSSVSELLEQLEGYNDPNTAVMLPYSQDGTADQLFSDALNRLQQLPFSVCTIWVSEVCPKHYPSAATLWVTPETAEMIFNGDMLEYSVSEQHARLDVSEDELAYRLENKKPSDGLLVRQINESTWVLNDRYTRMFLLAGEERALLIDTGFGNTDPNPIIKSLTDKECDVILTHSHWDHAGGVRHFRNILAAQAEIEYMNATHPEIDPGLFTAVNDGDTIDLGNRPLTIIFTPGHTAGSLVILDKTSRILFAGDSVAKGPSYVFMSECSLEGFGNSLKKVQAYAQDFDVVMPSHRDLVLPASIIPDLDETINRLKAGTLAGEGTSICRLNATVKTYWWKHCGIFYY